MIERKIDFDRVDLNAEKVSRLFFMEGLYPRSAIMPTRKSVCLQMSYGDEEDYYLSRNFGFLTSEQMKAYDFGNVGKLLAPLALFGLDVMLGRITKKVVSKKLEEVDFSRVKTTSIDSCPVQHSRICLQFMDEDSPYVMEDSSYLGLFRRGMRNFSAKIIARDEENFENIVRSANDVLRGR